MSKLYLLIGFLLHIPYSALSQNLADTASFYVKEYKSICDDIDKKIWGISLNVPLMFLDSTKDVAYLGQQVKKGGPKKYENIFVYPLDEKMLNSIPIMEWKGLKWVVVNLPFSGNIKEVIAYIAHEAFHVVQKQLTIPGSFPSYTHFNTVEGRFLMHMEILELYKALGNQNRAEEYISNAISIRNYRNSLFPGSDSIETRAEMNEGLAEYTGDIYAQYTKQELLEQYKIDISNLEEDASFTVAVYPYLSGSIYAFLNDKKSDKWKDKIPEYNVHQITVELYQLKNIRNINTLKDSLFNNKHSKNILNNFKDIVQHEEQLETQFKGNVLVLNLSNAKVQMKSNIIVTREVMGTIYNNVIVNNEWGSLEVNKEGRALISREENTITLNADSLEMSDGKVIRGGNWVLFLSENYKIEKDGEFHFLELK